MRTWDKLYIAGAWRAPDSGATLDLISPVTEEVVGRVPAANARDAEDAVLAARQAFDEGPWPRRTVADRAKVIRAMTQIMLRREAELGQVATEETAMPSAIGPAF